jgi:hypothetical protein
MSERRQWRPYLAYLQKLAEQSEARGEPPTPDTHDQQYWDDRAKWHAEQQREKQ